MHRPALAFALLGTLVTSLVLAAGCSSEDVGPAAHTPTTSGTGETSPPATTPPTAPPPAGDPCASHCGNGKLDCGETAVDCGGSCNACPALEAPAIAWNEWLPADHATSGKTYPLVVWLHGKGGDETSGPKTMSPRLTAANVQAIYVYPGAGDETWTEGQGYLVDQIVKKLIPYVLGTPKYRANGEVHLEGFSMGGNGCYAVCANTPGLCKSIITYGAAMHEPEHFSGTYSPWKNVANLKTSRIRMVVGTADNTQISNQAYHAFLEQNGVTHEYVTLPDVPHSPAPYYAGIDEFLGAATPFDFHFAP